jgi:indolepyruvate ferredoxin oxidoreductase
LDIGIASAARTLESRYLDLDQPMLLTGVQALVRVLLEQARLDRAAGLRTGGLVSGYRGSPLGGLDQELWRRAALLDAAGVRFQPGLNEDLAATMLWGSQQLEAFPGARVQGVFGMWYGKGPGVDRSADALRCANHFGTSKHGGVLAVSGDDHGAHSSVFPHQTDQVFEAVMIPVLQPADAGEIVSLGLAGIAMSRFSGLWAALKTTAETAEGGGTILVPSARTWQRPEFALPPHGLNFDPHLAWPARRAELERRVLEERLPAARAWARANRLDRVMAGDGRAEIGIVAVGKAWHDLQHALRRLGLEGAPWLAAYKVALAWPIETEGLRAFARGKRALIVVEEKRSLVEAQLRDALYNLATDERPPIAGKTDLAGAPLLPAVLELSPESIVPALARVLDALGYAVEVPAHPAPLALPEGLVARAPMFCAGCPHNTSTVVPAGGHAMAGIGCHAMAVTTSDATRTLSQMGGEGVPWLGMAPFTELPHMFANMGDGTYQHSGLLAIRQAVAAGARITYKLLFNDAVAMTGGQPAEGGPTPVAIARQVAAEGVGLIALVADQADRLPAASALPPGTLRHTRDELDAVQKRLSEHPGVSVLIYDQVCATEKRRRRKRGTMAAADRAVIINERVCENCGDCTVQSNCIAIEPVETEYGRKRRISPTSCNTDLTCLKGFCPSFVTAPAAAKAQRAESPWLARETELAASLPDPALPSAHRPWRGLFAGIGGGGIITTGSVVAMAAHLEERQVSVLDFTGLAQKNGAVVCHVQIADPDAGGDALDVVRIPAEEADFTLAADLAVAAGADMLQRCRTDAVVVGNLDLQAGAGFLTSRDIRLDAGLHRRTIERRTASGRSRYVHAAALSERLFGSAQVLNTVLLGMAWQKGLLPVGEPALLRAFELNGTAVALNHRAFLWGRLLAHDPALAGAILDERPKDEGLDALVERRAAELVLYGDEALASRYRALVVRATERERVVAGRPGALARAVAEGYFRVLAYKDEYEVARLHAASGLPPGARVHLSPPLPLGRDKATGRRRKIAVPGWLALPLFRALRHGKRLRGTALDPFGWQADRRTERRAITEYEADIACVLKGLRADQVADAAALARLPLDVRGFGPVKAASAWEVAARQKMLLDGLGRSETVMVATEFNEAVEADVGRLA